MDCNFLYSAGLLSNARNIETEGKNIYLLHFYAPFTHCHTIKGTYIGIQYSQEKTTEVKTGVI